MPTDAAFRLSTYLTLALACAAVGYAESPLLPEVGFIAGAVVVALAVLYRLETRVELLSIPAANRLGLGLAVVYFGWAGLRIAREVAKPEMMNTDWQLLLVALFGPLLLMLMPAKLARREKHAGDYWGLHAAGLAAAALAAAMAEDPVTFVLLGLYAVAAVWSLVAFYTRRATGAVPPVPNRPAPAPGPPAAVAGAPGPGTAFPVAFRLAVAGAALAVPLYLLTPRSPAAKLDFGKPRVEIGFAADQMTDLNQTGPLGVNDQVAFEVTAEEGGIPKIDLSPGVRWRGRVLRRYVNGMWVPGGIRLPGLGPAPRGVGAWSPPDLGPGQVTLTFSVPARLRSQFLAEPVMWVGNEPPPVATLTDDGPRGWAWVGDGSFLWDHGSGPPPDPLRYVQVWRPGADPDAGPVAQLAERDTKETIHQLVQNPVPRVKEYADRVVQDLARAGGLPADYRDPISLLPRLEFHDAIARGLARHLATTPDLAYTTNLRRDRKDLDPVEDFLFHTRSGHCERFATALVLMLRSQGIPAVLVLGFKGCEPGAEPGRYVVRQEFAHAWVDALIPVVAVDRAGRGRLVGVRWLSLDPTPAGGPETGDAEPKGPAGRAKAWVKQKFNRYFVDYTPEQRRRSILAAVRWVAQPAVLGTVAAGVAGVFLVRYARRRRRAPTPTEKGPEVRWFDQLLAVLAAHGFAPGPGETPREFAAGVAEALARDPATAAAAGVSPEWADAYYEARFGGNPLEADRRAELDARLGELQRTLAKRV